MSDLTPPPVLVQPVDLVEAEPNNEEHGSPKWWLYELESELNRRATLIWLYEDYYEGRHKLTFASTKFREAFGQMLAAVSDNWIPLVISAAVERLQPQGFLFGGSQQGDDEAWRIWQENFLDADAPMGFTEACKHGESYMLVWPDENEKPKGVFGRLFARRSTPVSPRITLEHPSQMVVRRAPGDRRRRVAALKRWREDDGTVSATLYLPDEIHYFSRKEDTTTWTDRRDPGKNDLGVVPVVPLVNEPHMLPCRPPSSLIYPPHGITPSIAIGLGRSDQADIITTVDQINKLLCDMLVASEVSAFRQRWATGLEVPRDETTDEPIEPFKAAVDRLWIAEGEDGENVKFGEFSATDLKNYTDAMEGRIQSLAARTRTPPHYLLGQMVNISADAITAAEAGLASKTQGKQASFGESIEEVIRIAFAWQGDDRANDTSAEVAWAQCETRSESAWVDSLVKKLSLGVPKEQLWIDAGYSPQQINRFKTMLLEESILNPPPVPPGPAPGGPTPPPPPTPEPAPPAPAPA